MLKLGCSLGADGGWTYRIDPGSLAAARVHKPVKSVIGTAKSAKDAKTAGGQSQRCEVGCPG